MTAKTYPVTRAAPLAEVPGVPSLVVDWLTETGSADGACGAWRSCLEAPQSNEPAPAWSDASWRESWWTAFSEDLPDETAVSACRLNLETLVTGAADVIVTGQQPAFLGGPLYTLYKTATCVAAAAARSAAGRPTVPLFWAGDDDDDLREAFAPRLFDPKRGCLVRAVAPEAENGRSVGALPAALAGAGEAAWLAERAAFDPTARRLSTLWRTAIDSGATWGRLQSRALLSFFGRHGLLVASGDDPRLHATASPFTQRLLEEHTALADLAARRGARLVEAGHHAQIGAESLARPFSVSVDGRRHRLGEARQGTPDPSDLRPGVLFRSPVQDWLFRPAAVVVGPGELSYLMQTAPVYEALDLPRPPLLPRLFCTLEESAADDGPTAPVSAEAVQAARADVDAATGTALADALSGTFGLDGDAAKAAAAPVLARWSGHVGALFERYAAGRAGLDGRPIWRTFGDRRQERVMATHWATALWGDALVDAALEAARAHLEAGAAGRWADWRIVVGRTPGERTDG